MNSPAIEQARLLQIEARENTHRAAVGCLNKKVLDGFGLELDDPWEGLSKQGFAMDWMLS